MYVEPKCLKAILLSESDEFGKWSHSGVTMQYMHSSSLSPAQPTKAVFCWDIAVRQSADEVMEAMYTAACDDVALPLSSVHPEVVCEGRP